MASYYSQEDSEDESTYTLGSSLPPPAQSSSFSSENHINNAQNPIHSIPENPTGTTARRARRDVDANDGEAAEEDDTDSVDHTDEAESPRDSLDNDESGTASSPSSSQHSSSPSVGSIERASPPPQLRARTRNQSTNISVDISGQKEKDLVKSNGATPTQIFSPIAKPTLEDARSIAVMVEDNRMLGRADLEEALVRNLYSPVETLSTENIKVLHAATDKHLPWIDEPQQPATNLRFVPQTRVFYINRVYRTVFVLDVSSSVLTVDTSGSKIVMGQVMETLEKCLLGLAERFSCPGVQDTFVDTEIRVTVIAECSQFASNVHTGEMLAQFPTMKVLLQDFVITESNIHSALNALRKELAKFQARLSRFRGKLRRTRDNLGYILAVEEAADEENTEHDREDDISERKSWGVGLSGANLSYTLKTGLFALDLMPYAGSPSIVFITDGVVKSNLLHGSLAIRRMMELDVSCSIIQLGHRDGFNPNCNWGFIQDTEVLRFVSEATLGKFLYSHECLLISSGVGGKTKRTAPNMYHRSFLIREHCLLKPRPGLDDLEELDDSIGYSLANFPWDPRSQPEPVKMMQTACKEYLLNIPVLPLVSARIQQGFRIKYVHVGPDKDRPSMERYVIAMTLSWLPNVTVQYRLRGYMSNNNNLGNLNTLDFFSRLESPKIEIDIVAYQAFALHFLNSQQAPLNTNHSVYAKVYRLHRYIVGLSDSDVKLRGLCLSPQTANQHLATQRAKANTSNPRRTRQTSLNTVDESVESRTLFLDRLKEQWVANTRDVDSQYTLCWYTHHEFDILVEVPPPNFMPTDGENSLVRYSENVEAAVDQMRNHIKSKWATFVDGKVFVRIVQGYPDGLQSSQQAKLCELTMYHDMEDSVIRFHLKFFGIPRDERILMERDLRHNLVPFQEANKKLVSTKDDFSSEGPLSMNITKCFRPISHLMMRHLIYEAPLSHAPENNRLGFHTHVSEPVGEESVMRSYLLRKHWGWKDQVRDSSYVISDGKSLVASQDMAFQYICAQRIQEGYLLASVLPNRVVFYKELPLDASVTKKTRTNMCATQYLIFRSPVSGELVTEVWMEPSGTTYRRRLFEQVWKATIKIDRHILASIATFEALHIVGRRKLRPNPQLTQPELGGFVYPDLFDPPTLLRQHRLLTMVYDTPVSKQPKGESDAEAMAGYFKKCLHTFGLANSLAETSTFLQLPNNQSKDTLFSLGRHGNTSSFSLASSIPDTAGSTAIPASPFEPEIVELFKDRIRELTCADRDLVILHLFLEQAISQQIAEGEIIAAGEDDSCDQYFAEMKDSIRSNPQARKALRAFSCANTFQDIRCFVKTPNARCTTVIMIPKLSSIVAYMTRNRPGSSAHQYGHNHDQYQLHSQTTLQQQLQQLRPLPSTDTARHDCTSIMVFECLRNKPLTDVKEYGSIMTTPDPRDLEFQYSQLNRRPPEVVLSPPMFVPSIYEAQRTIAGNPGKMWDSTETLNSNIEMVYSQCFTKAIYASLLERHTVESSDLDRVMRFCSKTSVDISITGFLNVLQQQRLDDASGLEPTFDLTRRFTEVFSHAFDLVPVQGTQNIYFYRPRLRKATVKSPKPKTRKRSPSVSRSGSIDGETEDVLMEIVESAERPIFLQLECSFQKPAGSSPEIEGQSKPHVRFPVSGLPTSYIYEQNRRKYDYAPAKVGMEGRPVDSADGTTATFHLVFLTLPVLVPDDKGLFKRKVEGMDSASGADLSNRQSMQARFPNLDPIQQEAIVATEARLEWLLKEEIMHGLLSMNPVTGDILNLVSNQLKERHGFESYPTSFTHPLQFVKKKRGYEIFLQELRRVQMSPYELHQVGNVFYLTGGSAGPVSVAQSTRIAEDAASSLKGASTMNPALEPGLMGSLDDTASGYDSLESNFSDASNDLCQGLGIVILPDSSKGTSDPSTLNVGSTGAGGGSGSKVKLPKRHFWLLITPKDSLVQINFFSKVMTESECSDIVAHVRSALSQVCTKVNQLTLLQSLNETRMCSKFLVPVDKSDTSADSNSDSDHASQEDDDDDGIQVGGNGEGDPNDPSTPKAFRPGEFACPMVYRVAWPLHWRVKAGLALKTVSHAVLYPFAVQNRANFFVVESKDDLDETKKIVVFLRLSEVDVTAERTGSAAATPAPVGSNNNMIESHRNSSLSANYGRDRERDRDDDSSSIAPTIHNPAHDDLIGGSHQNSPRPSPAASPGSRAALPPAVRTETRELVIEVFGVDIPGKAVTVDLFSLLESKFYNTVVLPIVAQFWSRNSTLKLTYADADFILPVERLTPVRQTLRIPNFISAPFAFLMYLKQNMSLYLNTISGTDKVTILKRHYLTQFGRNALDVRPGLPKDYQSIQVGEFSFFYNAVQGRTLTPLETQVGLGLAGVCLTMLGSDGKPVFDIGFQQAEHDMNRIRAYFDSFPNFNGHDTGTYSLMIEIWPQGAANANALLDAVCQSFRQSLCDDIIETSIAQDLCSSSRDRGYALDGNVDPEPMIDEHVQKSFIDPSFNVLQYAYEWRNPAVQSLKLSYSMPPWIMDSYLMELDDILTDVSVHFSPLLIRSMADSPRYREYKASSGTKKSYGDMTNIKFIMIGGVQDLSDSSSANQYARRTSMGSERSHSRRSSLAENLNSAQHSRKTSTHSSQQHPRKPLEEIKMYPNAVSSSTSGETMLSRNCFVVIVSDGFGLQAFTYNWGRIYHEFVFHSIEKVIRWHKDRMRFLDNVLLQKMGLFHHVPAIVASPLSPPQPAPSAFVPSSHVSNMPRSAQQGTSPHIGSSLRPGLTESNTSLTASAKVTAMTSPKSHLVQQQQQQSQQSQQQQAQQQQSASSSSSDTGVLSTLVEEQFPNRSRPTGGVGSSVYSTDDLRYEAIKSSSSAGAGPPGSRSSPQMSSASGTPIMLPNTNTTSSEQTAALAHTIITAALDVDQILRDACLEPLETPRDQDQIQDEVRRHGMPFMETFTYHTKVAEEQQNAFNVYQKWSRRYKDRKGAPKALHENMNTSDLAIMLRSSRLLHFCRTPLLFTEFSSSLFSLAGDVQNAGTSEKRDARGTAAHVPKAVGDMTTVELWYSNLAEAFMREYSQYLGTIGMQLLMYGNSTFDKPVEPSQPGELSFMSEFTIAKGSSVASPAAFLFKSLQGGSIMCEVRLQGMFVCVTLYTLNRRYGKITVAAPGFATAEANKQSLRVFTEQCARFKDRIHVNSFVYDFHLRYMHRILMQSARVGVGAPSATNGASPTSSKESATALPYSFDLLDVLHQFLQYHSRPAAYARNRVYRGVYTTKNEPGEPELPRNLFDYLIKNPQRYGFQAIHYQNQPRACFVSGHDLLSGVGNGLGGGNGGAAGHGGHHSRSSSRNMKGFGVGPGLGGLSMMTSASSPTLSPTNGSGSHIRHMSHESNLNQLSTRKPLRRLAGSKSSYSIKDSAIMVDNGVEYLLLISDGVQDRMGLMVHYYLVILREEEVVKKLEATHGPLVGRKDRLMGGSHNLLKLQESTSQGSLQHLTDIEDQNSVFSDSGEGRHQHMSMTPMIAEEDEESGQVSRNEISSSFSRRNRLTQPGGLQNHQAQASSHQSQHRPNLMSTDSPEAETTSGVSREKLLDESALQEHIAENVVLADVVRTAEARLNLMLKQAAQFFDRDSLWEMLLAGKIGSGGNSINIGHHSLNSNSENAILTGSGSLLAPSLMMSSSQGGSLSSSQAAMGGSSAGVGGSYKDDSRRNVQFRRQNFGGTSSSELGFAEFLALGQRFHSTPLEDMDDEFKVLMTAPGIDWGNVLTFLARSYSRWAREFTENEDLSAERDRSSTRGRQGGGGEQAGNTKSDGSQRRSSGSGTKMRRHLVIFNPHNRDLLVHFVLNLSLSSIEGDTESTATTTPAPSSGSLLSMRSRNKSDASLLSQTHQGHHPSQSNAQNQPVHSLFPSGSASGQRQAGFPRHPSPGPYQYYPTRSSNNSEGPSRVTSVSSIARAMVSKVAAVTQGITGSGSGNSTASTTATATRKDADMSSLRSGAGGRSVTESLLSIAGARGRASQAGVGTGGGGNTDASESQSIRSIKSFRSLTGSEDQMITATGTILTPGGSAASAIGSSAVPAGGTGSGSESAALFPTASRRTRLISQSSGSVGGGTTTMQSAPNTPGRADQQRPRRHRTLTTMPGATILGGSTDTPDSVGGGGRGGLPTTAVSHRTISMSDHQNSSETVSMVSNTGFEERDVDAGKEFGEVHRIYHDGGTPQDGGNDEESVCDGDDEDENDDYFAEPGVNVRVFSVSREPKSGYNAIEADHVGDIVRTLSYFMWRTTSSV